MFAKYLFENIATKECLYATIYIKHNNNHINVFLQFMLDECLILQSNITLYVYTITLTTINVIKVSKVHAEFNSLNYTFIKVL